MDAALGFAREAAGLARDAGVTLRLFPEPESPWRQALDLVSGRSETAATTAVLTRLQPLLRELAPLVRDPAAETLSMPPTGLLR